MSAAEIVRVSDGLEAAAEAAAAVLRSGGLAIIPTETVYGLVADGARMDAVERIYAVKRRERGKPLQLLVSGVEIITGLGYELNGVARRLADAFWPGALTLVIERQGGAEGFRVPDCRITLEIIRRTGGLLRATSANVSGEPAALTARNALDALGNGVDLVVDDGMVNGGIASSVVKVAESGEIEVLREGTLSREKIWAAVEEE